MRVSPASICLVCFLLAINAAALMPVLESPFLGDDSWRESTLRGIAQLTGTNLLSLSWETLADFSRSGRWYPLVIYYYPIFYYLDQYEYKLLVVCAVLVNVLLFGWLVRVITGSFGWGLAAMALAPFVVQLRFYHDAVLSYYCLMQIEFALLVVSAGLFLQYVRGRGRGAFVGSVACYTASLLMYEAFYLFWMVHVAIALVHFGRDRIREVMRTSAAFFLVAAANALVSVGIRATNTVYYEGVDARFSAMDWARAFAVQVFSALPFSYAVASDALANAREAAGASWHWSAVLVGVAWAAAWWLVWTRARAETRAGSEESSRMLLVIGLAFWVLSAPIVALSAKYQRELNWGLGYLPTYVSGFGVMMVALAVLREGAGWTAATRARSSRSVLLAAAVVGGVLCGFNYANNRIVVERYNLVEHQPRKLIEQALDAGIMRPIPDLSVLVCDEPLRGWDNPAFFRQHCGLTLQVVKQPGFWPDPELGNSTITAALAGFTGQRRGVYDFSLPETGDRVFSGYRVRFEGRGWPLLAPVVSPRAHDSRRRVFLLSYRAGNNGPGYAVLAQLTTLTADQDRLAAAAAGRLWLYIARSEQGEGERVRITGRWVDASLRGLGSFTFHERDLELLSSNRNGKLFSIPDRLMEHAVDPRSIEVRPAPVE